MPPRRVTRTRASRLSAALGLDFRVLRELAVRLRDAYAADPSNAALARELRVTLLAMARQRPEDRNPVLAELMAMVREVP